LAVRTTIGAVNRMREVISDAIDEGIIGNAHFQFLESFSFNH